MVTTDLYIATEDALSEAVADRLVLEVNHGLRVAVRVGRQGNGYLQKKFSSLAKTAYSIPVLLLTDLDRIDCPSILLAHWRGEQILSNGMLFRVAVREIEAWLLADREGFSNFCGIPLDKMPQHPELLDDPKQTLLSLVRRYATKEIKAGLLPERGSSARIGYAYNQILVPYSLFSCSFYKKISCERHLSRSSGLARFVRDTWSVISASRNADSLAQACRRLHELSERQNDRLKAKSE